MFGFFYQSIILAQPVFKHFFRKKVKEQREKVIAELLQTEREYCRDLRLTCEIFKLHEPEYLNRKGVDCPTLFGNILEVRITSDLSTFSNFILSLYFVGNSTVRSVHRSIESVQQQQRRCKRTFHRQKLR